MDINMDVLDTRNWQQSSFLL